MKAKEFLIVEAKKNSPTGSKVKTRNPVAKNLGVTASGAGAHRDKKRDAKMGVEKHKKSIPEAANYEQLARQGKSPWDQGWRSFWNNVPHHYNPYEKGTPEYKDWDQGWRDADMNPRHYESIEAEAYNGDPSEYHVLRHETQFDKDREITLPAAWTKVKQFDSYQEAKQAYEAMKAKYPKDRFTITTHRKRVGEGVAEGLVDYVGRKLQVKTTKGKPDPKNAPEWATALGQTPQGAWHWLEKDGPTETPDSDRYFPLSGKTEFTGFVSEYEGQQGVSEGIRVIDQDYDLDQIILTLDIEGRRASFTYTDYDENFENAERRDVFDQLQEKSWYKGLDHPTKMEILDAAYKAIRGEEPSEYKPTVDDEPLDIDEGVSEGSYTTEKQILTRIRQIQYDRKLSGTDSNAGELLRLKQQLKDMRSQQGVSEAERNEMDTPEFQRALASLKKSAAQGPKKTVYDPKTGKYKVVPVNAQGKKNGRNY